MKQNLSEENLIAVQYNRLFKMMIDRKMTPAELRDQAGISSSIITHLKKDEFISVRHRKICRVMQCGAHKILEFMPDKEERKQ